MADKDKLRDMLDAIIDDKGEQAQVAFHGYLEQKMKDMLNPPAADKVVDKDPSAKK